MGVERRKVSSFTMDHIAMWWTLLLAIITFTTPASSAEPRVVCYYTNWSVYRPGTARFNPQNINPYLCTHLIYAFGGFTKDNAFKPFDKYQDIEKGGYAKFTGLKTYNKNLKTLLAIGGWNEGSSRFSPMVASKERRREFVRNAIKFLRQNRFDGLDLDWEYPAFRDGGKTKDRENYAKLVRELREEFERESEKSGRPRLLLTMAVPAGIEYIHKGFDVKTLNEHLDWMNLLTYDYHSAFEPAVNHHAPLYPLEEPNEYSVDNELNIDYTIKYYLENGADREKLVLGIPTYGRSYTLFNPDATEIGAPADGPGEQGDATREKGYLAYYEICEALKPKDRKRSADTDDEESDEEEEAEDLPWTVVSPNPSAMGPIAFKGNQWVGYDDINIVKKKAEYVAENGLGGIMFWSIDNDDFRGTCHGKPYPLIESAKEAYIGKLGSTVNVVVTDKPSSASSRRRNRPRGTSSTTEQPAAALKIKINKRKNASTSSSLSTTPTWNVITPEPPTTPDPGSDFKCTDEGFFQHPRDCKKYFWCLDSGPSNLGIVAHQFTCPSGLFFNKASDSCDFARNVLCKKPSATTTTKAPTTKAPTTHAPTTEAYTTTRRPVKLSTKSSTLFRTTTTTTTTTPEPEVVEYIDDNEEAADIEAQDPKVIKELIDLIKKVGGVEQLEKQLRLSESQSEPSAATTARAPFNNILYQKVLQRTRANKITSNSLNDGSAQNSRRGPQNAGIESDSDIEEKSTKKDGRPQYTTINRSRKVTSQPEESDSESDDSNSPNSFDSHSRDSLTLSRARAVESDKVGTTTKPLQYVNIRRARPTATSDTADDSASRNALFERAETFAPESESSNSLDASSSRRESTPNYVTIRRQRPTTEEATTAQYQNKEQDDSNYETILEKETSSPPSQPQYASIERRRSTTTPATTPITTPITTPSTIPSEQPDSPEPTTVLSVQISSLLNAPSPDEVEEVEETEVTSVTDAATTTTSSTTAAPSTSSPSSLPPRRAPARRRSTTTPAPAAPAAPTTAPAVAGDTTQVSERNYTFVRRRRPPARPNRLDSDSEEASSRKVRSTTPESREVEGDTERTATVHSFRSRSRQTEDSVPAAATPVSRGQFRPRLNAEDLSTVTAVELDFESTPQFSPRPRGNSDSTSRRFRGRNYTPATGIVADSEVSAASVEVQRQNVIPRGRSRYVFTTTTTESPEELPSFEVNQQLSQFNKFAPRPFSRNSSPPATEESVKLQNEEEPSLPSTRLPSRLPFGRIRIIPTTTPVAELSPRKLSFNLRNNPTANENDDEAIEDNKDDIKLSESTIEEKEHQEVTNEPEDVPKRRIVIKKIKPTSTTEKAVITTTESEETTKRRFKIIRRRPTSTTAADAVISSSTTTEIPQNNLQRIRKVIRKKLKPIEDEPEIIAKSIDSFNAAVKDTTEIVANYGEKTKSTLLASSTAPLQTEEDKLVPETTEASKPEENTEKWRLFDNYDDAKENEDNKTNQVVQTESQTNSTVQVETNEKSIDIKEEVKEISSEPPVTEVEVTSETTTKASTTQETSPSTRSRQPYRPPKRVFTTSTESPAVSSRTYSRKFNPGVYTSPATVERATTSRRPLFQGSRSRPFTRRPFTTARTTKKVEDEEYTDDEASDDEPQDGFVVLPPNQLFTRKPSDDDSEKPDDEKNKEGQEVENNSQEEEIEDEGVSSKKPNFRPRLINSNTFRTSTSTTELPKKAIGKKIASIYNRLNGNKQVNETKKRVVNVPVGYNAPKQTTSEKAILMEYDQDEIVLTTTTENSTAEDDDYLTVTVTDSTSTTNAETQTVTISDGQTTTDGESQSTTDGEGQTTTDNKLWTNSDVTYSVNEEMEVDNSTDDYLEQPEETTKNPNILEFTWSTNSDDTETTTTEDNEDEEEVNALAENITNVTNDIIAETTTAVPKETVLPIVKKQFDKLFSVSRVVEVSSKLDKHRLNKKNESRLIEEGKIKQEKKPTVDKIGEVSRFSVIKIVEDDIPIYLTTYGHIYPVDNPPDNPIRIDEARNARALVNFSDGPRENLVASESINESYRHLKKVPEKTIEAKEKKDQMHQARSDDFLSYINEETKTEQPYAMQYYQPDPVQWQFVPAAYENERMKLNKAAKSFEIITPRNILDDPSTLPLEGLFKTENPVMAKKISDKSSMLPFLVYSASVPKENSANVAKSVPESDKSIKTYAKGQEMIGSSVTEHATVKYPTNIAIVSGTTDTTESTTNNIDMETITSNPNTEFLTNFPTTFSDFSTATATNEATTETAPEETTTQKLVPVKPKNSKFAFPRRPIGLKSANITRPAPTGSPRVAKKNVTLSASNNLNRANKTTGFNPSKTRFTANRAQNVPIDLRSSKKIAPKPIQRSYTTEAPRSTTEKKVVIKPIRPNFRPAFVPRRPTPTTKVSEEPQP